MISHLGFKGKFDPSFPRRAGLNDVLQESAETALAEELSGHVRSGDFQGGGQNREWDYKRYYLLKFQDT